MNLSIEMSLADKIRQLRRWEGLSQRAFCEVVGINRSIIANVESGETGSITVENLQKIASHPRFIKYAIWLLFDHITEDQARKALDFLQSELEGGQGSDAE